jgi:hypothetical protein
MIAVLDRTLLPTKLSALNVPLENTTIKLDSPVAKTVNQTSTKTKLDKLSA